jgi:hypothetical protein
VEEKVQRGGNTANLQTEKGHSSGKLALVGDQEQCPVWRARVGASGRRHTSVEPLEVLDSGKLQLSTYLLTYTMLNL